jgi:hypothetical protein
LKNSLNFRNQKNWGKKNSSPNYDYLHFKDGLPKKTKVSRYLVALSLPFLFFSPFGLFPWNGVKRPCTNLLFGREMMCILHFTIGTPPKHEQQAKIKKGTRE